MRILAALRVWFTDIFTGRRRVTIRVAVEDASRHKMVGNAAGQGLLLDAMNRGGEDARSFGAHLLDLERGCLRSLGTPRVRARGDARSRFRRGVAGMAERCLNTANPRRRPKSQGRALARTSLRSEVTAHGSSCFRQRCAKIRTRGENCAENTGASGPADTGVIRALADTELRARAFRPPRKLTGASSAWSRTMRARTNSLAMRKPLQAISRLPGRLSRSNARMPGRRPIRSTPSARLASCTGDSRRRRKTFSKRRNRIRLSQRRRLLKRRTARWLAGDLKGRDALQARFLDLRRQGQ